MCNLTESMLKHLCTTCKGICEKGVTLIKTEDTLELHCCDYKPDKQKIKELAYKDNKKVNITATRSKSLMNLNI